MFHEIALCKSNIDVDIDIERLVVISIVFLCCLIEQCQLID